MKIRTKLSTCRLCGARTRVVDPAHLRTLRLAAGMSLEALAVAGERKGCPRFTRGYLADVETGRRSPSAAVLEVYERVLGGTR